MRRCHDCKGRGWWHVHVGFDGIDEEHCETCFGLGFFTFCNKHRKQARNKAKAQKHTYETFDKPQPLIRAPSSRHICDYDCGWCSEQDSDEDAVLTMYGW